MATAVRTLQNFIDGEFVDPADGATASPSSTPRPARTIARGARVHRRPTSTAPSPPRARPSTAGRPTTPGERALALLRIADAIEEHADELAELEATNAGKPLAAFRDDEIPFMVDNLRFFAGAARCLEGKAAGEYLEGYTSMIRREPVGVIGQIAPVELPADDGGLEDRPRARHRQHDRAQAGADDAGHHAAAGRARGRVPAQGRAQRGHRRQRPGRGARHPRRRRHGLAHRLGARPASGSPRTPPRRSSASTSSSAARRRSWSSTTSTWRRRWRRSPAPATTTPARTARRPRACSRARRSTTTSSAAWPSRPRGSSWATPLSADTTLGPAQLRAPARAGRGLPRAPARPRRGRHRRAASPTSPASSSSRRSWRTCSRTTR